MIDTQYQFEFVSRQFACYFLGITGPQFDKIIIKETPIEFRRYGRCRRYSFSDLARLIFPEATDQDIQVMRVIANIHFAGVKRGRIKSGILEKENSSKKKK